MLLTSVAISLALLAQGRSHPGRVTAPPVQLGNGTAYTWIQYSNNTQKIQSVGITFWRLPSTACHRPRIFRANIRKKCGCSNCQSQIFGQPFDHVEIDWNPIGHPPLAYYNKPHFDFHFFTISMDQLMSITATGDDIARCMKRPPDDFIPQGYILLDHVTPLPQMGVHWTDSSAPEIKGAKFTSTFVYGTYNGKTAFWEPMITLKYLLTKPEIASAGASAEGF